jgi:hypothetical protein
MTNPYKTPKMTKASLISPRARMSIFDRLMNNARVNGECLEYGGSLDHNGYGRFKANGRQLGAHRVAYVEFIGDIEAGKVVMHSCDNPACINPNHMSIGTVKENVHDCIAKGRFVSNIKSYRMKSNTNLAKPRASRNKTNKIERRKKGDFFRPICLHKGNKSIIFRNPVIAIQNGFNRCSIYNVLNGRIKTANGYEAYYL